MRACVRCRRSMFRWGCRANRDGVPRWHTDTERDFSDAGKNKIAVIPYEIPSTRYRGKARP